MLRASKLMCTYHAEQTLLKVSANEQVGICKFTASSLASALQKFDRCLSE